MSYDISVSVWFTSLTMTFSRSIHVAANGILSIFLMANIGTASMFSTLSINSVQFSRSVVSNSLWLHGLQHTRPPCPSPTSRVYSNSSPLTWWCHSTISSSVVPISSHLRSVPASGSFLMSQFFTTGGQSIGPSASASVLPIQAVFT